MILFPPNECFPMSIGVRMKEYDVSSANKYLKGNLQKAGPDAPISDTVMKGMKYYLGICTMTM